MRVEVAEAATVAVMPGVFWFFGVNCDRGGDRDSIMAWCDTLSVHVYGVALQEVDRGWLGF